MRFQRHLFLALLSIVLSACKHPLAIQGQGDIVERNQGLRGCSLEEFAAASPRCTDNDVRENESVVYQALPRAGWVFSHWKGCAQDTDTNSCNFEYLGDWAELWDREYAGLAGPTLTAVFAEDSGAPAAGTYLSASFGSEGSAAFGALLETLVSSEGYYRHTRQLAYTRDYYDRDPVLFSRHGDGLLYTAPAGSNPDIGGWATSESDLLALVDTDAGDNEISVTYMTPQLSEANSSLFTGKYYCGRISTSGAGEFSEILASGNGTGVFRILAERRGQTGQAAVAYSVAANGTMSLSWGSVSLTGNLSTTGDVYVASQLHSTKRGTAVCIRANSGKSLLNVAGNYLGAWISLQPVTAVTELLIDETGTTAESVHRDSLGGRSYSLGVDWILSFWDGRLSTSANHGAISGDGRTMFIVYTNPSKYPTLVYYTRKPG
jgi:hypothetical protein